MIRAIVYGQDNPAWPVVMAEQRLAVAWSAGHTREAIPGAC
jgi:hypothetical protein